MKYLNNGSRKALFARITIIVVCAGVSGIFSLWISRPSAVAATGGILSTVTPQRILDTRGSLGGHNGKLGGGQTMTLSVVGTGGIPQAHVAAVLVNVTALNNPGSGYLTLYQTGSARPSISSLDYPAQQPTSNEAIVPVGADGTVSIYNYASGGTDVLVDTEGWVSDVSAGAGVASVQTGQPTRVLDTRTTTGGHKVSLTNGQSIGVQVGGVGGIPTGVSAVFADIIAVPAAGSGGFLTAYAGGARPQVSNVNFAAGAVVSTMSLVPLNSNGTMSIYNGSTNTNVVVDVMGWVSGGDPTTDAGLQATTPTRVLDTRTTVGGHNAPVSGGQTLDVPVLGKAGIPNSGVAGVVVHITGAGATSSTYLKAFGSGYSENGVNTNGSLLNEAAGAAISNTTVVPVGANGAISVYNYTGSTNVIVDVQGWIAAPALTVVPPLASAFSGSALTSTDGVRAAAILTNANKYAMTTWWNSVAPGLLATPMTDAGSLANSAIRRLSMQAYSLATALATNEYDASATGVPVATARADVAQIINTVAAGQMVNTPGGWGQAWGDDLYAAYDGTAAWMLWPYLSPQTQTNVARMVYAEANWGVGYPLQYYANPSGTVLTPGDTGSDTDSWLPLAAQLAAVMMPTNANVPIWKYAIVKDALAAWARPSDIGSSTMINGATLGSWINGSNVLADGSVLNHGRIAYDYSSLIYQNMQDIFVNVMAGTSTPQATTALLKPIYNAYTAVNYPSPPYNTPGGSTYTPGSSFVYYPQGNDWGTGQEIPYALVDAESAAFGIGNSTSATYEDLHANAELAMQRSHSDGHTYDSDSQYTYVGREEHVAQEAAQLFFTKWVRDHSLATFNNDSYALPLN